MSKMPKYFMYFPGNYRWKPIVTEAKAMVEKTQ
jgi:hypothetical protein